MTTYTETLIKKEVEAARLFVRKWYGWKVARVDSWELRITGDRVQLAVHVCGIKAGEPVTHTTWTAM